MFVALATVALSATAAYSQSVSASRSSASGAAATAVAPSPSGGSSTGLPVEGALTQLSPGCRSAVLSLATSPITECLNIASLAPAITSNTSIVPVLDQWMTAICSSEPCDQQVLDSAAQNFSSACAEDVEAYNVDASDIEGVFGLYPLVRELVCLKTTEPFNADNATSTSNSTATNGTSADDGGEESAFCVTSLLDELSSYLGFNLTVESITGLVLGSNTEGRQALTEIPPTAVCQDCIQAAAGLIELQYPFIWSQPLVNGNFTVSGFINGTCSNETFPVIDYETNSVTLPDSVFPSTENSTFPYEIEYSNGTYTPDYESVEQPPALPFANAPAQPILNGTDTEGTEPSASASSITSSVEASSSPVATSAEESAASAATSAPVQQRDVTAAKRRWVGQQ